MSKIKFNFDDILSESNYEIDPGLYLAYYFNRLISQCDLFTEKQLGSDPENRSELINSNRELIVNYLNDHKNRSYQIYRSNIDEFNKIFQSIITEIINFNNESQSNDFWLSKKQIEKLTDIKLKLIDFRNRLIGGCLLFFEGYKNLKIGSLIHIEPFGLDDMQEKVLKQMKEQNEQAPMAYVMNEYLMNIYRCLKFLKLQKNFKPVEIWSKERVVQFEMENITKFEAFSSIDKMAEIQNGTFENFKNLAKLELKGNHTEKINELAFQSLSNLVEISLRNNFLRKLEPNTFKNLFQLKKLDLSDNQIEEIDQGLFNDLRELESLFFNSNCLRVLDQGYFHRLENLKELYLNDNGIYSIFTSCFRYLKKLEILDLSQNRLDVVKEDYFKGLKELKELSLVANRIKNIEDFTFEELKKLEKLFLAQNLIEKLHKNFFLGLENVTFIDLHSNLIESIDGETFEELKNLKNIQIKDNPCYEPYFINKSNVIDELKKNRFK